jgi:L-Ala-D/L-Glu epimerase
MLSIQYFKINFPFQYPFTISKGTKTHQPSLLVRLGYAGKYGFGEAPAITYYNTNVDEMAEQLEKYRKLFESYTLISPERFWHFLHHLLPNQHFLICALDMAAWDLFTQLRDKPLSTYLKKEITTAPVSDYTIGIDTAEVMLNKMKAKPWPIYKIKCGTAEDVEKIVALRAHTQAPFRLDANAGWDIEMALKYLPVFNNLNIQLIEQPLAKDNFEAIKILKQHTTIPIIADESCVVETDVDICGKYYDGINIKLTKCGGITPALRMIDRARELNLKIMLGCMNETSVGSAAMYHLAPWVDYVDADGPLLLTQNVSSDLYYNENGEMSLAHNNNGLGIKLFKEYYA